MVFTKTHGGRTADAYYRSHHEFGTVIRHSLEGAVALIQKSNITKKGITLMELFNLKHSVRLQCQVIFQVPTLIELDGLVTPISALDFNSTTVMPSFKQRFDNSAHGYSGLFLKDAVPIHDTPKNTSTQSPDDNKRSK